jgi:hypothetical protein
MDIDEPGAIHLAIFLAGNYAGEQKKPPGKHVPGGRAILF